MGSTGGYQPACGPWCLGCGADLHNEECTCPPPTFLMRCEIAASDFINEAVHRAATAWRVLRHGVNPSVSAPDNGGTDGSR